MQLCNFGGVGGGAQVQLDHVPVGGSVYRDYHTFQTGCNQLKQNMLVKCAVHTERDYKGRQYCVH
jgi:hypothetical protein